MIGRIFVNPVEGRLRAPWRFLGTLVILVALVLAFGFIAQLLAGIFRSIAAGSVAQASVIGSSVFLITVVTAMLIAAKLLDRRPFSDYGFNIGGRWWGDFAFGLFLGAFFMTLIFLAELAMGWVSITATFATSEPGGVFLIALLPAIVIFICVGIYEEMLTRGYVLVNLSEGLNLPFLGPRAAVVLAWALSSGLFGLAHASNPNATWVSTTNLVIAGLLLGLGFILTGQLALSIGMHITWNFFQGNVYGFPVSGTQHTGATFIAITQGGPEFWTGGSFGPEGGMLGVVGMVLLAGMILLWVRYKYGRIVLCSALAEPPRVVPPAAPQGAEVRDE